MIDGDDNVDIVADTEVDVDAPVINLTTQATTITLIDANASSLSFDASGKTGILEIVTTNGAEEVKMSGTLEVTGNIKALADLDIDGDIDMATGKLITWVADDQFISGVDGTITVDGDDNVNIIADTEVDITSDALVDVNAVTLDLYAAASASIISPSLTFGNDEVTFNGTGSDDFVAIKRGALPGLLRLYEGSGGGDNYVAIQAGNVAGASDIDYTFTWPVDDGADGQILKTDGSGVLTWVSDQTTSGSVTNSNVFGTPVDDQNVVMTFDSYQTNGVFSWMENEDYFKYDFPIFLEGASQLYLRETGNYIKSPATGKLEIASNLEMSEL